MKTVLFVCDGNTCRSPMAAGILRAMLKEKNITDVKVLSYGLYAEVGDTMNIKAKSIMRKLGIRVGGFRSKQITENDIFKVYAVITMTQAQKKLLPYYNVISAYDLIGQDIPDPYGKSENYYEQTASVLKILCEKIIKEIEDDENCSSK